jgi:Ca2+-binding EF-hand superfamily protein
MFLAMFLMVMGTTMASIGAAYQDDPQLLPRKMEESTSEELKAASSAWIYVGELLLVIILSICFERGQDALLEYFKELGKLGTSLEQMMKSLSKEILILGVIGLLVYVATKTEFALDLARPVYPAEVELSEEENPLSETFETVHMIIFCVMICFIFQCGIFMWKALVQCKEWEEWENMRWRGGEKEKTLESLLVQAGFLHKPRRIEQRRPSNGCREASESGTAVIALRAIKANSAAVKLGDRGVALSDEIVWDIGCVTSLSKLEKDVDYKILTEIRVHENPVLRMFSSTEAIEALSWRAIRQNFMFPPSMDNPEYETYRPEEVEFFHFHEYLSIKLAEEYTELMEISPSTWIVCSFLTFTIPFFMSIDPYWFTTMVASFSWLSVAFILVFGLHISSCFFMVTPGLPPDPKDVIEIMKGSSLAALKVAHRKRIQADMEQKRHPTASHLSGIQEEPTLSGANGELGSKCFGRGTPVESGSELATDGLHLQVNALEQNLNGVEKKFEDIEERLKTVEVRRGRLQPVPQAQPLQASWGNGLDHRSLVTEAAGSLSIQTAERSEQMHPARSSLGTGLSSRFFDVMGDNGLPPYIRADRRKQFSQRVRDSVRTGLHMSRRPSTIARASRARASTLTHGSRPRSRSVSEDSSEKQIESNLQFRPRYLQCMVRCHLVELERAQPSLQEQLFFMEELGPEFFRSLMQLLLFFQAVVNAIYVVVLCTATLSSWTLFQWFLLLVGICGVLVQICWLIPYVISRMVIIKNIEMMKDRECCEEVIRAAKKARIMESIRILEMAKMKGKLARLVEGKNGKLSEKARQHYKDKYDKYLSQKKKDDIMKVFQMFDADHSGEVDETELVAVLSSLGFDSHGLVVQSAGEIMQMIDVDGNNCLDVDEFKVLMAITLIKESPEQKKSDYEALFNQFDEDGSGEVSITELAEAFLKLGVPMTEDSMADLVNQVLQRSKQSLKPEDFVQFMEGLEDMADKE